jgi:hypothetical protein
LQNLTNFGTRISQTSAPKSHKLRRMKKGTT